MTGPGGTSVRPALLPDIDALVRIEEEAFATDRLDRRAFRHAVLSPTILALVDGSPGSLRGYVLVQVRRGSAIARLTSVAVAPGFAGRGIGRRLVDAAEDAARRAGCGLMRLEMRADNEGARALYEGRGYREFATVPDYYEDGTAAIRLEKPLG